MQAASLHLPDGRTLDYRIYGPEHGDVLLFHHGTPGSALAYGPMVEAAAGRGLRMVTYARPGYGNSTPHPGRTVADAACDAAAILDAVGAQTFRTIGWSGGGPHALACSAVLRDRCLAAVTIAGVAPYVPLGAAWMTGMGPENVQEFSLALQGADALTPFLEAFAAAISAVGPDDVAAMLGGLLSEVDQAQLTAGFAQFNLDSSCAGFAQGVAGQRDDDLAFVKDWGFDLDLVGPVVVWQGAQDRMVPYEHGIWLADHLPGARRRLFAEHGHLSIALGSFERIMDDLLSL